MFIIDKIPVNSIKRINITNSIECILIEMNVGKKRLILIITYRPPCRCENFFQ